MIRLSRIIGALFPHACLGCGLAGTALCTACKKTFPPARQPAVRRPATVALHDYRNPLVRKSIYALKYRRNGALVEIFAQDMVACMRPADTSILVPIPPHVLHRLQRGWSQTHRLAKEMQVLAPTFHYRPDILKRTRPVAAQAKLPHEKRRDNVRGSFMARFDPSLGNKPIYLVDDVVTTGATIKEAYKALHAAGYRRIKAITIAH